jgi:hypothetical protein
MVNIWLGRDDHLAGNRLVTSFRDVVDLARPVNAIAVP